MSFIATQFKRLDAQEIGPNAPTDLTVWLSFQIAGNHVLLPLLVATFLLFSSVSRHPTVINVCCTWIIAGVVSSLLFYTGHHVGPEPPKDLCIAQSALLASVPPMASVAALSLVYYTWSMFRPSKVRLGQKAQTGRLTTVCLVTTPYIVYICFAVVGLQYAVRHADRVDRARRYFYCSIHWDLYNNVMGLFTATVCLIAAALEAHIMFMLSRNWTALRRAGMSVVIDLQLTIRAGIFTAYVLCGTVVMLATVANARSIVPDMWAASIGMAFFLVFATQPDVLRVWANILSRRHFRNASRREMYSTASPERSPTPLPSFDCDLLERTNSDASEKARLAALHAYYKARVHLTGVEVEVIKRPEDAFLAGNDLRRA
ncbi:hypothetical protein L226DRAFT_568849 [Lentinus tigrinus ALCF2SS1-7]|uniref:uncharacterized protein n=1 Tax=Lentinus tigrinus ALCF2SS1-7 TaxID=1328758 RepID=UPI00116609DD|nr:hypothetical protein L226DRAFT_568849 [Lentinus tigrinus ALCF2SS1-7]